MAKPISLVLDDEVAAGIDRRAAEQAIRTGRLVTRSAMVRQLLAAALASPALASVE